MKIFLDTDVLIDVALDRKPFSNDASLLLDKLEMKQADGFIAWHSLSNLYYICSSSVHDKKLKGYIKDLLIFLSVSETAAKDAIYALGLNVCDFEDAMQISAAMSCKADFIVTRNIRDFKHSPIQACLPGEIIKIIDKDNL
ncbi:MAG: PIN domain-containing protein [Victivallales bacterium]|jgi:predicted nucleic acid-binding protein